MPGPTCGVARLLDHLPDDTADKLQRALASRASHTKVAASIAGADDVPGDLKPSRFVVSWHRRGECACGKP